MATSYEVSSINPTPTPDIEMKPKKKSMIRRVLHRIRHPRSGGKKKNVVMEVPIPVQYPQHNELHFASQREVKSTPSAILRALPPAPGIEPTNELVCVEEVSFSSESADVSSEIADIKDTRVWHIANTVKPTEPKNEMCLVPASLHYDVALPVDSAETRRYEQDMMKLQKELADMQMKSM